MLAKDVSLYLQYWVYNYEQILNYMYSMKIDNEYIFIRWTTIIKNDIITIITNFYFYIIYNTFILEIGRSVRGIQHYTPQKKS
jgi:hypothetical protein